MKYFCILFYLPCLPSVHQGSWTSSYGDWFPREQTQKLPNLLRPSLELAWNTTLVQGLNHFGRLKEATSLF